MPFDALSLYFMSLFFSSVLLHTPSYPIPAFPLPFQPFQRRGVFVDSEFGANEIFNCFLFLLFLAKNENLINVFTLLRHSCNLHHSLQSKTGSWMVVLMYTVTSRSMRGSSLPSMVKLHDT
jgi:hypothetical protein